MRYKHLLARPIAAVAVLGVAIIGLAGTAGATTISVSVPPVLGNATSSPVVTVGSGSVAPVPGADVTAPAHGDSDVSVDSPTTSAAVPAVPAVPGVPGVPVALPQGRLASGHSSIDACIAAALLSGHTPSGCGVTVVGSQPLADSLSQVGSSPSLAGVLTQVGACVRLAFATGQAIDTCSTPVVTPGPSPTTLLGSAPVPVPVSPALLDDGTVAGVLADNGLCSVGQQLGLSGLSTCLSATGMPDASGGVNLSTSAGGANLSTAANGTTAASRWTGPSGSAAASGSAGASGTAGTAGVSSASLRGASDQCLGLAAVTGADPRRCASTSVHGPSGRATANGSAGIAQQGTAGAAPAPSTSLNASCASRTSGGGGTSPFRSDAAGGFAGLGLVLAGLGRRLRRVKRPVLG